MTTRNDYIHQEVYGRVTTELAEEAGEFWGRNRIIASAEERRRRAQELAAVVRDNTGRLAGVGTAYRDTIKRGQEEREVFMYRTFIEPQQRRPLLFLSLFFTACSALEKAATDGKPSMVAFVTENKKFMRAGVVKRVFEANGFKFAGYDPRGLSFWIYPLFWDGPHRNQANCVDRPREDGGLTAEA